MPVSADTSATAKYTFTRRDGSTIDFSVRFMSRKDRSAHRRAIDALEGRSFASDETWVEIHKAIAIGVVGWSLDKPFSADAIDEELTERELWSLAQSYPRGVDLTEDDLGKSEPQPATRPEPAAANAETPAAA